MPIMSAISSDYKDFKVQGYTGNLHDQDINTLNMNAASKTADATVLTVGKDADTIAYLFHKANESLAKKLDGTYHQGPLKKLARIYEKTFNYGIADAAGGQVLNKVRDILRGTIVLSEEKLREKSRTGDNIIDKLQTEVKGARVVRIKNRFIQSHFPVLIDKHTGFTFEDLAKYYVKGWSGRDWFYRDIQILIGFPNHLFPQLKLDCHVAELQITTEKMYGIKSGIDSAHKDYKIVRSGMEYLEFLRRTDPNGHIKTWGDWAKKHYENVIADVGDPKTLTEAIYSMWNKYYKGENKKMRAQEMQNVIDNSKWYAAHKTGDMLKTK